MMNRHYCVMTYDEWTNRHNIHYVTNLYRTFQDAIFFINEKHFIQEHNNVYPVIFNPDDEFKWDLCICVVELHDDTPHFVYPVNFYKIKENYMHHDSNPIRLIDLMKILGHTSRVSIRAGSDLTVEACYDTLYEIPERLYSSRVNRISEIVMDDKPTYSIVIEYKEDNE